MPSRHIHFENVFNFRDMGGYRTNDGRSIQWRRIFRSSELHEMNESDAARAVDDLGVRTIIDLRESTVAQQYPPHLLKSNAVSYHNMPLIPKFEKVTGPISNADFYIRLFNKPDFGARLVDILETMAESTADPIVFHCSAGKDRAGIVAAMLLGALDVREDDIVQDYALSAKYMPALIDHWWANPSPEAYFSKLPPFTYDARPETMSHVLDSLAFTHGSMRRYLEAHGASQDLFDRLKSSLLA